MKKLIIVRGDTDYKLPPPHFIWQKQKEVLYGYWVIPNGKMREDPFPENAVILKQALNIPPYHYEILEPFHKQVEIDNEMAIASYPDPIALRICIAVTVANRIKDPNAKVWVALVGAPSSGKTETVYALEKLEKKKYIYYAKDIAYQFVSPRGRDLSDHPLMHIVEGGTIINPDAEMFMNLRKRLKERFLAILRIAYDGRGTVFRYYKQTIEIRKKFGLIICLIPTMERMVRLSQLMGERFLYYRMVPSGFTWALPIDALSYAIDVPDNIFDVISKDELMKMEEYAKKLVGLRLLFYGIEEAPYRSQKALASLWAGWKLLDFPLKDFKKALLRILVGAMPMWYPYVEGKTMSIKELHQIVKLNLNIDFYERIGVVKNDNGMLIWKSIAELIGGDEL